LDLLFLLLESRTPRSVLLAVVAGTYTKVVGYANCRFHYLLAVFILAFPLVNPYYLISEVVGIPVVLPIPVIEPDVEGVGYGDLSSPASI
jgi:hypothetical protein